MARDKDIKLEGGVVARPGKKRKHLKPYTTLYEFNIRDVAKSLRKMAKAIEAGEYGEVEQVLLIVDGDKTTVHGFGPQSHPYSIPYLTNLANTWFATEVLKAKGGGDD
jgi:hypothetical protein